MSIAASARRHFRASRPRDEAGFTLIELLVVLVILGLLVGLVGPQVIGRLGGARSDTAKLQIQNLVATLDLYRLDVGRYPTQEEGLAALVKKPASAARWNGPYLKAEAVPLDPWGRAYLYKVPGKRGDYDIVSLGADGKDGGEGEDRDVSN